MVMKKIKRLLLSGVMPILVVTGISAGVVLASNNPHQTVGPAGYDTNETLVLAGSSPTPTVGPGDHVVICHALGNVNGSYNQIAPSAGDVFGHAGPSHQSGMDIIPPFKYVDNQGDQNNSLSGGQNWDVSGIATYNNGCQAVTPPEVETGSITVVKHLSPTTDSGVFNLKVGDTTVAANVSNNGQGTKDNLEAGSYNVSETAGTNTDLANYTSSVACTNDATGTTSVSVSLSAGQDVTCTFTNTRIGGHGGGPVTDCDGDTDNSPQSDCTTTTTPPQVLGESTTSQVAVVPQGSVNGGEGAASRVTSPASMVGMVAGLLSVGSGLALLNRKQN